jgi:hypothetical protein
MNVIVFFKGNIAEFFHPLFTHFFYHGKQYYKKQEEDEQRNQWIPLGIVDLFGVSFKKFEHIG